MREPILKKGYNSINNQNIYCGSDIYVRRSQFAIELRIGRPVAGETRYVTLHVDAADYLGKALQRCVSEIRGELQGIRANARGRK